MKIGVIGSGHIGATAARLFTAAGHEVAIANRRGPDSLRALELELGGALHATTVEAAAGSAATGRRVV
jgi:predicted dinucleotide-binding enzyme